MAVWEASGAGPPSGRGAGRELDRPIREIGVARMCVFIFCMFLRSPICLVVTKVSLMTDVSEDIIISQIIKKEKKT